MRHPTTNLTRRTMLGAAAACAAVGPAVAQIPGQPGHVKGPRVFMDYDQAELDAAYDQSVYAPNIKQITGRYVTNSDVARRHLGPPQTFSYGPTAVETLDVYRTKRAHAPTLIFIHGGAWRAGHAKDYAFPAEVYVNAGANYVVPNFVWVQDAGGNLATVVDQVRRSVAWVYKNAARFGGDARRLYVAGHSSGGHLAGVLLTTDWHKDFGLPADLIKGGVCGSGMYDLYPVSLSARGRYVNFTPEVVARFCSLRHLDKLNCPISVVYGTYETPEFQRQNRDFVAAVKAAGKPVDLHVADGYNHFEVMETLANPYGFMGRAALARMKLAPA